MMHSEESNVEIRKKKSEEEKETSNTENETNDMRKIGKNSHDKSIPKLIMEMMS
jgi:hypothetical protein